MIDLAEYTYYLAIAALGGFMLNLMPCVLPAISLKFNHLCNMQSESSSNVRKNLFAYNLGFLSTFFGLGLVVVAMQQLGHFIGWGFQLQSPIFVGILAVLMLLLGLNMWGLGGLFDQLGTKFSILEGRFGQRVTSEFSKSFLLGVFTTLVATPCSGPMMAAAMGYALALPPIFSVILFGIMGIGAAFPFIMLMLFPGAVRYLPRPGRWMLFIKGFMGLCAILSSIWLFWLLGRLV